MKQIFGYVALVVVLISTGCLNAERGLEESPLSEDDIRSLEVVMTKEAVQSYIDDDSRRGKILLAFAKIKIQKDIADHLYYLQNVGIQQREVGDAVSTNGLSLTSIGAALQSGFGLTSMVNVQQLEAAQMHMDQLKNQAEIARMTAETNGIYADNARKWIQAGQDYQKLIAQAQYAQVAYTSYVKTYVKYMSLISTAISRQVTNTRIIRDAQNLFLEGNKKLRTCHRYMDQVFERNHIAAEMEKRATSFNLGSVRESFDKILLETNGPLCLESVFLTAEPRKQLATRSNRDILDYIQFKPGDETDPSDVPGEYCGKFAANPFTLIEGVKQLTSDPRLESWPFMSDPSGAFLGVLRPTTMYQFYRRIMNPLINYSIQRPPSGEEIRNCVAEEKREAGSGNFQYLVDSSGRDWFYDASIARQWEEFQSFQQEDGDDVSARLRDFTYYDSAAREQARRTGSSLTFTEEKSGLLQSLRLDTHRKDHAYVQLKDRLLAILNAAHYCTQEHKAKLIENLPDIQLYTLKLPKDREAVTELMKLSQNNVLLNFDDPAMPEMSKRVRSCAESAYSRFESAEAIIAQVDDYISAVNEVAKTPEPVAPNPPQLEPAAGNMQRAGNTR